jgi:hypothetical protein
MKNSNKKYYYLVSGEVMFADEKQEGIGTTKLNTTIVSDNPHVDVRQIGRAQQALQMHFFQRIERVDVTVVDVFLLAISPLGHMTEEEFNPVVPEETNQAA